MSAARDAGSNGNWINAPTSEKQRQADSSIACLSWLMSRLPLESAHTVREGSVSFVYSFRRALINLCRGLSQ